MNHRNYPGGNFTLRSLLFAIVPSYVFPALMSGISGIILQKSDLIQASYTTIGISSLLSTLLSFLILWQLELKQILVAQKLLRSLVIILLMMSLGVLITWTLQLQSEYFNITFSAFLGATILTIRQPIKIYRNERN
ncbi:hypothetical protein [Pedobacter sp. FW305-3-2-15-E-R2A2]|jgi:hypothetical protein|uniref:hypothetical protein n=1 Tax=Pedobacter sp. FW305-3-2-15-E-R2A2 TaxID=3140251 RepID=UPI0031400CC7